MPVSPRRTSSPRRPWLVAALCALVVLAAACADGDGEATSTTTVAPAVATTVAPSQPINSCPADPPSCTLRAAGDLAGVLVGAAVAPDRLDESAYAETVATQFSSITPENHMKWPLVHPAPDEWDFEGADRIVEFAEAHDIAVKGHTLIWGQSVGNGLPDWVLAIDDPDELRAVVDDHIATLVGRYTGRIDRWDVVNEPLLTLGAELDPNHLHDVLGPGYIAAAFEAAHRADPEAALYLNEHSVEVIPAKAEALLALLEGLVADGVPIDGVGLQAHQFTGVPPEPGVVEDLVGRIRALGLEVAITELDVPLTIDGDQADQAAAYAQIVGECLAAGCTEITVWGVDDASTWLDDFLGREDTQPLLFDDDFAPKATQRAVVDALLAAAA